VEDVGVGGTVPGIWVAADTHPQVAAALRRLRGRVALHAVPEADHADPREHFLLVYLVEAASAEDAAAMVAGAADGGRPGSVVTALAEGRRCAVLVAACVTYGRDSFETATSLARFHEPVTTLLG
jgi:hypothetical protein